MRRARRARAAGVAALTKSFLAGALAGRNGLMKRLLGSAAMVAVASVGAGASPPYDADIGPAAPNEHPAAPSVKSLRTIAPGAYEVWAYPVVAKGHLFYADAPKLTGSGDAELDMGELEGPFRAPPDKKRRYAVRVMDRDAAAKTTRTIVPIRP